MLTHSTVSICRKLLADEVKNLDWEIHTEEQRKVQWGVFPSNLLDSFDRKIFLRFCNRVERLKARKAKVENAIRELKAWTGNPEELA